MVRHAHIHARLRARGACVGALALAALAATAPTGQGASTGGSVVGANVLSATAINASGCATGTANVTMFGSVSASSSSVTSSDCVVTFGSSNDTARLRVQQTDNVGDAMYQELGGGGALDLGFAGGVGMFAEPAVGVVNASDSSSSGGIARQSTGRFLVAGENGTSIVVRRYLPDGTLDGGFGPVSVAPCATDQDVTGIAVASDDSFYIGGDAVSCGAVGAWAMRFSANGAQDMTYAGDGRAETGIAMEVRDIAVHRDGTVALGGGGSTHEVIRFLPTGLPDNGFDGDGHVSIPTIGGGGSVRGIGFLPDGSIIASGYSNPGGGDETYVARLLPTGAFHGTFGGGDGWERTNHPTTLEGRSLAIAADGAIYVAAYQGIVKFTSAGLLDGTFGTGGIADFGTSHPLARFNDVVVQHDGSPVAFGQWNSSDVVVARTTPLGAPDGAFGTSGVQVHDPAGTGNSANHGAWTEDGDLLLLGAGSSGASIVRLDGLTISDYHNASANWTTPGTNQFGACLVSATAGASALWTTDGACTVANGLDWNEVTPTAAPIARTTVTTTQGATVNLRFGLRTLALQRFGTYIAPVTFSVVAPDA